MTFLIQDMILYCEYFLRFLGWSDAHSSSSSDNWLLTCEHDGRRNRAPFPPSPQGAGTTQQHCHRGDTRNAGTRPTVVLDPLLSLPAKPVTVSSNCSNGGFETYPSHIQHEVMILHTGCWAAISCYAFSHCQPRPPLSWILIFPLMQVDECDQTGQVLHSRYSYN